jgi:hypothetical protein
MTAVVLSVLGVVVVVVIVVVVVVAAAAAVGKGGTGVEGWLLAALAKKTEKRLPPQECERGSVAFVVVVVAVVDDDGLSKANLSRMAALTSLAPESERGGGGDCSVDDDDDEVAVSWETGSTEPSLEGLPVLLLWLLLRLLTLVLAVDAAVVAVELSSWSEGEVEFEVVDVENDRKGPLMERKNLLDVILLEGRGGGRGKRVASDVRLPGYFFPKMMEGGCEGGRISGGRRPSESCVCVCECECVRSLEWGCVWK